MFVEPRWSYEVVGETVKLDIMGATSAFELSRGPRG
jgi:hypothetical protein